MKPQALYLLKDDAFQAVYGPDDRTAIENMVSVLGQCNAESLVSTNLQLQDVEIIISGWGSPVFDQKFLNTFPKLQAVFYGAGSIRKIVTEEFWQRDIAITSAYTANAIPVAEYTLATILLSLKHFWYYSNFTRAQRTYPAKREAIGNFDSTIGLISLGTIGRMVLERLKTYDLKVLAYDPYVSEQEILDLGAIPASLDEIFHSADVVSLHAPRLEETIGMITGEHFKLMKPKATFINTARGTIVREKEMLEVLEERTDLYAVLDTVSSEPPKPDSPLYHLPNVVLTPHIAGSVGNECRRMARLMVEELGRFLNNKPLRWRITREQAQRMA